MNEKVGNSLKLFIGDRYCIACNMIHNGQCSFAFIPSYRTIILYEAFTNSYNREPITIPITLYATNISIANSIFSIGGNNPMSDNVSQHNIFHHYSKSKQPIPYKSYAHSVCYYSAHIYCISGINGAVGTNPVETTCAVRYSIIHNKWSYLPPVVKSSTYGNCFVLDDKLFYMSSPILTINLKALDKWDNLSPLCEIDMKKMKSIPISKNEVVIFGGDNAATYILNKKGHTRQSAARLCDSGTFDNTPYPSLIDDIIYASDTKGRIHLYFTRKKAWWMVTKGKIHSNNC